MDYSRIMTGTAADCLLGDPPVTHGWLCTHPMQPGPAAAGGLQGGLILIYGVWSVKQCYTLDSNIRFYMECQIKTCLQSNHLQISRLMDLVYIYITLSHYISAPVSPVSHCQGGAMAIVPTIINVWSWVPDLIWSDFEEPSWGPAFKSLEIMFGMFVFVIKIYEDNNDNMISEIENWSIVRFLFSFADSRQNLVRKTDFQGFADSMRFLDLFVLRDVHTFLRSNWVWKGFEPFLCTSRTFNLFMIS